MTITEIKGDVTFLKDNKGKLFQKFKNAPFLLKDILFKITDGKMSYKRIISVNGCDIKYNTNGVYGFSVFKGGKNLEDNIWEYDRAIQVAKEMN